MEEEPRALLEERAARLAAVPLRQLVERYNGKGKQVEEISGQSGIRYRLTVEGMWDRKDADWETDFFVWLRLRAPMGWRRWRPWKADLIGDPETERVVWAQRDRRAR